MKDPRGRRRLTPIELVVLMAPASFLAAMVLAPLLVTFKISLSTAVMAAPPYTPVFKTHEPLAAWIAHLREFNLSSYAGLLADPLYLDSYLSSILLAGVATMLALAIAFPMALAMSRAPQRFKPALVLIAIAPFWTSFLIRVYAWIAILKDEGFLNQALRALGLIRHPLHIYATNWAVLIGVAYSYLPFMILPIFEAIDRQDQALLEAAADLGASRLRAFWRVTAPLALPGVLAGCLLVFIPAVGEFVTPDLLGGSDTLMIGRTLWTEFFENRDWPTASAVAMVLLALLLIPGAFYERLQSAASGGRRS